MGFYTIFEQLCKERGVSPAQVRNNLGISQSTMASWKSRGLTPKAETMQKLADYFGVSVDYLLKQSNPFFALENKVMIQCNPNPLAQIERALEKLSYDGQQEAVKRVEELTEIPRYQAKMVNR